MEIRLSCCLHIPGEELVSYYEDYLILSSLNGEWFEFDCFQSAAYSYRTTRILVRTCM